MAVVMVRVGGVALPYGLDTKRLVQRLNRVQKFYEFSYAGSTRSIEPDRDKRHHSVSQLAATFRMSFPDPDPRAYPFQLALTGERIEDDHFTIRDGRLGLISSADTELILKETEKSLEKFFAFNIVEALLWLQYDNEHGRDEEDTGCLFDSCYDKRSNVVLGLRSCEICANCEEALLQDKHVPVEQVAAVRSVLKWVRRLPRPLYAKLVASMGLLAGGVALLFFAATLNVGLALIAISGWIAAAPHALWGTSANKASFTAG